MDGKRTAENPFEKIVNLPLSCWGTAYIARAAGPNKVSNYRMLCDKS